MAAFIAQLEDPNLPVLQAGPEGRKARFLSLDVLLYAWQVSACTDARRGARSRDIVTARAAETGGRWRSRKGSTGARSIISGTAAAAAVVQEAMPLR